MQIFVNINIQKIQSQLFLYFGAAASSMAGALSRQLRSARQRLEVLSHSSSLASPTGYLEQRQKNLEHLRTRLIAAQTQQLQRRKQRFIGCTAKLDAMSPLKVLTRGYSIVNQDDGSILRSVTQTEPGREVRVTLTDGSLRAVVSEVKENAL